MDSNRANSLAIRSVKGDTVDAADHSIPQVGIAASWRINGETTGGGVKGSSP